MVSSGLLGSDRGHRPPALRSSGRDVESEQPPVAQWMPNAAVDTAAGFTAPALACVGSEGGRHIRPRPFPPQAMTNACADSRYPT